MASNFFYFTLDNSQLDELDLVGLVGRFGFCSITLERLVQKTLAKS